MDNTNLKQANQEARDAWNANASFWNDKMGEGNRFVEILIWLAAQRLLGVTEGETTLDVACGNGLTLRRLSNLGQQWWPWTLRRR